MKRKVGGNPGAWHLCFPRNLTWPENRKPSLTPAQPPDPNRYNHENPVCFSCIDWARIRPAKLRCPAIRRSNRPCSTESSEDKTTPMVCVRSSESLPSRHVRLPRPERPGGNSGSSCSTTGQEIHSATTHGWRTSDLESVREMSLTM